MEIPAVPQRRPVLGRGWLVGAAVLLAAAVLFLAAPALLGLDSTAVPSKVLDGRVDRGTLLFSQRTSVGEVEVGDVIRFDPPAPYGHGELVTREVVRRGVLGVLTGSDEGTDPWELPSSGITVERAVAHLDYAGYAFLGPAHRAVWGVLIGAPVVVIAVGLLDRLRRERREVRGAVAGTTDLVDE